MLFVPVQPIDKIFPVDIDVQHAANLAWDNIIEIAIKSADNRITSMKRWLSANAIGGCRGWVDILRREPSSVGRQRIFGHAGYRFRDPEEGIRFKQEFELSE